MHRGWKWRKSPLSEINQTQYNFTQLFSITKCLISLSSQTLVSTLSQRLQMWAWHYHISYNNIYNIIKTWKLKRLIILMQIISSDYIHNYFQSLFIMLTANTCTNFLQASEFAGAVTCVFCFSSVSAPFFRSMFVLLYVRLYSSWDGAVRFLQAGLLCLCSGHLNHGPVWKSLSLCSVAHIHRCGALQCRKKKKKPFFIPFIILDILFLCSFSQVILLTANIYVKRWLNKCTLNFRTLCNCVSCGMKLVNWTGIAEEQQNWLVVISFACWSVLTPVSPFLSLFLSLHTQTNPAIADHVVKRL